MSEPGVGDEVVALREGAVEGEVASSIGVDGISLSCSHPDKNGEEHRAPPPSSFTALRTVVCGCACSRAGWKWVACGRGAWKTWTCCVCTSLFLFIGICVAIYLPTFLYLDNSPYACPASRPPAEQPSVPPNPRNGYTLVKEYSGPSFLEEWDFFTEPDPTQGCVNYVDRSTALERNLTFYDNDTALWYLQTDHVGVVSDSARGRDSVRLHSKATFTRGVFVMEVAHIPAGCATWPAWWLTNDPWPTHGEIDVIEQIHGVGQNSFVGHTKRRCDAAAPSDSFKGSWKPSYPWLTRPSTDCTLSSNPQGCAADLPPGTFGAPFNQQGGGAFGLVWDDEGARVYFWSEACGGVPADLVAHSPLPASWGLPMARFDFSAANCPPDRFYDLYMVINLTFCGTWAGSLSWMQCAFTHGLSCDRFVRSEPQAFRDAYWAIRSIRVYQ